MKEIKNKKSDLRSTKRFGYEWGKYSTIIPEYELQFLKWIYPLKKEDFLGKKVLDAGCGIGRNSFWSIKYGAKMVTAFDYDKKTVESARKNLAGFSNCEIIYDSIYDINYQNKFDIAFSIGVIHHLEFPKKAVASLVKAVKPNGTVLIWVYGYEGNEWITKYINPIRKITSKLPVYVTHTLAYCLSIPLYAYLNLFRAKGKYLKQISRFRFWHLHSIVFDQLVPKIANYWKKNEVLELFKNQGLKGIESYQVNDNSWTIIGRKVA